MLYFLKGFDLLVDKYLGNYLVFILKCDRLYYLEWVKLIIVKYKDKRYFILWNLVGYIFCNEIIINIL